MSATSQLFSRELLAGYDPDRMAKSVALIVGAGALGQNVAQNLALSGIGEVRIVDKDMFEEHNRSRSPAYPMAKERDQFGMNKARLLAFKVKKLMTASRPVVRYAENWIEELGAGAFKDVSIVLACVDRPSARGFLSDQARLHGLPFIEGGFEAADITLSCYPAVTADDVATAPCWRCSHQEVEVGESIFSCAYYARRAEEEGVIPAIQNAAAVLAGFQCEAAILALHAEQASPLQLRAFDLNIRTGQTRVVKLATDSLCPGVHHTLNAEPIKLPTTADASVESLLLEIGKHFPDEPTIELASPLIWSAPCRSCKSMVAVHAPDWVWRKNSLCRSCGGFFPGPVEEIDDVPMVYCQLSLSSDPKLLTASCKQVGLGPLSLVEAASATHCAVFELAGSIDELFKSGDSDE